MGETKESRNENLSVPNKNDFKTCIKLLKQTKNTSKLLEGCKKCGENVWQYLAVGGALQPLVALLSKKQKPEVIEEVLTILENFLSVKTTDSCETSITDQARNGSEFYIIESCKPKSSCNGLVRFIENVDHESASICSLSLKCVDLIVQSILEQKTERSSEQTYKDKCLQYAKQMVVDIQKLLDLLSRDTENENNPEHSGIFSILETLLKLGLSITPNRADSEILDDAAFIDESTIDEIISFVEKTTSTNVEEQAEHSTASEQAAIKLLFYISKDCSTRTKLCCPKYSYTISNCMLREFKRDNLDSLPFQTILELWSWLRYVSDCGESINVDVEIESKIIGCIVNSIGTISRRDQESSTCKIAALAISRFLSCAPTKGSLFRRRKLFFQKKAPKALMDVLFLKNDNDESETNVSSLSLNESEQCCVEHALHLLITFSEDKYSNNFRIVNAETGIDSNTDCPSPDGEKIEANSFSIEQLLESINSGCSKFQEYGLKILLVLLEHIHQDDILQEIFDDSLFTNVQLYMTLISVITQQLQTLTTDPLESSQEKVAERTTIMVYASLSLQSLLKRLLTETSTDSNSKYIQSMTSCPDSDWKELLACILFYLKTSKPDRGITFVNLHKPLLAPFHRNKGLDSRWEWTPTLEERYALSKWKDCPSDFEAEKIYEEYKDDELPWISSILTSYDFHGELLSIVNLIMKIDTHIALARLNENSAENEETLKTFDDETSLESFRYIGFLLSNNQELVYAVHQTMSTYFQQQFGSSGETECLDILFTVSNLPRGRAVILEQSIQRARRQEDMGDSTKECPDDEKITIPSFTMNPDLATNQGLEISLRPFAETILKVQNFKSQQQLQDYSTAAGLLNLKTVMNALIRLCIYDKNHPTNQSNVSDLFCMKLLQMEVLPLLICMIDTNSLPAGDSDSISEIKAQATLLVKFLVTLGHVHTLQLGQLQHQIHKHNNDIESLNDTIKSEQEQIKAKLAEVESMKVQTEVILTRKPLRDEWANLLNVKVNFPKYKISGETAFGCAIRFTRDDKSIMNAFLDAGIDVNIPDNHGVTPLMRAIACGFDDFVCKLVENYEADVDAVDDAGNNILKYAFVCPSRESLLEIDSTQLLENVSLAGNTRLVPFLLENGVDPNVSDFQGKYPLHWLSGGCKITSTFSIFSSELAMRKVSIEANELAREKQRILDCLLEFGAELNICDVDGSTALHDAIKQDCPSVSFQLIEKGAFVNVQDNNGNLPIHFIALGSCSEGIKLWQLLLKAGNRKPIRQGKFIDRGRGKPAKSRIRSRIKSILEDGFNNLIHPSSLIEKRCNFKDIIDTPNHSGWKPTHIACSGKLSIVPGKADALSYEMIDLASQRHKAAKCFVERIFLCNYLIEEKLIVLDDLNHSSQGLL